MKCVANCSSALLGVMVVLFKLVLVASSPVVPRKPLQASSLSPEYNRELIDKLSEAEFKDSTEALKESSELLSDFTSNDQRYNQLGDGDGVVYLESLTPESLGRENGRFHLAQVLGLMMDLLQKEMTGGDGLSADAKGAASDGQNESQLSACAGPCGRGQGTVNIPLCFSCVGLANAHLKPVAISRTPL